MENLERNCSYRIMFLFHRYISIRTGQIVPGGGDFVWFFRSGGRRFALKICPRGGDFDGKNYWPGGLARGMVTGQTDTCIKEACHFLQVVFAFPPRGHFLQRVTGGGVRHFLGPVFELFVSSSSRSRFSNFLTHPRSHF